MLIRREGPHDAEAIRRVVDAVFSADDAPTPESALVEALRADEAWLPPLSLVALDPEGTIIGHVLCSRGHVAGSPALGLAPLSVRPAFQRRGVGRALMHAALSAADALDEPLVALLGDPSYFSPFGFRPSGTYGIEPPVPEWRPHFQVRTLTAYDPALRGTFSYAKPFEAL